MSISELEELKKSTMKNVNGLVKGLNKLTDDRDMLFDQTFDEFVLTLVPKMNQYCNLIPDEMMDYPKELRDELFITNKNISKFVLFDNSEYIGKERNNNNDIRVLACFMIDGRKNVTKHIIATYNLVFGSSFKIVIDFYNGEYKILENGTSSYKTDAEAVVKFMEIKNELISLVESEFKMLFNRISKVINRVQDKMTKEIDKYHDIICN